MPKISAKCKRFLLLCVILWMWLNNNNYINELRN
jgi:hypothetical protein